MTKKRREEGRDRGKGRERGGEKEEASLASSITLRKAPLSNLKPEQNSAFSFRMLFIVLHIHPNAFPGLLNTARTSEISFSTRKSHQAG